MVELWTWLSLDPMITTPISPADSQLVPGCTWGADSYTGSTEIISSGSNGDMYQCNVTNFASNFSTVTLIGKLESTKVQTLGGPKALD